jgi:hypothetical protein
LRIVLRKAAPTPRNSGVRSGSRASEESIERMALATAPLRTLANIRSDTTREEKTRASPKVCQNPNSLQSNTLSDEIRYFKRSSTHRKSFVIISLKTQRCCSLNPGSLTLFLDSSWITSAPPHTRTAC